MFYNKDTWARYIFLNDTNADNSNTDCYIKEQRLNQAKYIIKVLNTLIYYNIGYAYII